jgi:hypothetical protein
MIMSVATTVMLLNVFLNPTINTDGLGAPDINPMTLAQKGQAADIGNETYDWLLQQRFTTKLAGDCTNRTGYTNAGQDVTWDC